MQKFSSFYVLFDHDRLLVILVGRFGEVVHGGVVLHPALWCPSSTDALAVMQSLFNNCALALCV